MNGESESDGGIFRLDLSDVSNGVKHEINPTLIFDSDLVGVFAIDYIHYKLIVPIEKQNTVKSMDLNGDKYEDIRNSNNTQTPMFDIVKSFAMANDLFYWTSGDAVLMEEYHEMSEFYYDNKFRDFALLSNFLFVCVKLPSAQPIPKPLNPPSNVQVLLSNDRAKVSWRIPHLLGIQGRGAWQDWTYELEVVDIDSNNTKRITNQIKRMHYTMNNLTSDTKYRFRVAAYTSAGYSPYSVEFRGRTLKTPHNRYLIWASHDGLIQSDILGDNVRILIPQQKIGLCNVTNIDWFDDIVLFVCNHSLYAFNRTNNITEKVNVKDSVQAIAIDWIGQRLYWFNPIHQVITRGNLVNFEPEVLFPISARDTDIKIDSLRGFLYFSTGHSVEFCRLNCKDKDKKEFYRMEAYSGKKVMGLTLDFDMKRVYWIVRSYDGSTLISAPMADAEMNLFELEEHILTEKRIQGPLAYLSSRLLWLQDDHTVVISNMTGKNLAHIKNIELNELKIFAVVDPTQHTIPDSIQPLNVIPESINASTIQVAGKWNFFRVSWQAIESVTYGEVFYDIRYSNHSIINTRPFIEIEDENLPPYSQLNITIKSFTYWASSAAIKTQIYSPPASPSKPTNTRFFMTHMHNPVRHGLNIEAVFRWNQPEYSNGPLNGYKISCWYEDSNYRHDVFIDYHLQPEINEKYMEHLPLNATLYCKVKAVNVAGEGNYSPLIQINTLTEKPIPRLFAARNEDIYLVDLDLNKHRLIVNAGSDVDHLCYIAMSKHLFWTNENNELMSFSREGKQKLLSINAKVLSITVDWIERIIYWSQLENAGSSINAFNLNTQKTELIQRCDNFVYNLNVAPMNREIFWIEVESQILTRGPLMSYRFNAENSASRFRDSKNATILVSQKTLFLDTFTENKELVLWLNEYNQLMSTDIRSKITGQVNFSLSANAMNLIKDSGRLYWTQGDTLYAQNIEDQTLYQLKLFYPLKILPIYRQNYPSLHCLLPRRRFERNEHISIFDASDRSLTLHLPNPKPSENCSYETVQSKYTIMYDRLPNKNVKMCTVSTCKIIETYDKVIEIKELQPFTKYQFQISISNYFTEEMKMFMNFTRPVIFQTKTGAPSRPRNVTAKTLSPTEIQLNWLPPIETNGDSIKYEVHYQTENVLTGVKNQLQIFIKGMRLINKSNNSASKFLNNFISFKFIDDNVTSINVTNLLPNQQYNVWIRAYTTQTLYNQSVPMKIVTLPDPEAIKLISSTSKSITIEWEPYKNAIKYSMSCRPLEYDDSSAEIILDSIEYLTNNTNVQQNGNILTVLNLHPKTQYMFWLSLYFENRSAPYTWPRDERFLFETFPDKPNAPGKPNIFHLRSDVYKVTWTAAENNGAFIEEYSLEALRYRVSNRVTRSTNATIDYNQTNLLIIDELKPLADEWTEYYSGNDTYWIIKDLTPISMYSFRVRAKNAYGWSEYSSLSEPIADTYILNEHREYLVIAVVAPALVTVLIVVFSCILCGKLFEMKKLFFFK